jgi:2-oxoglutarate ferredoxin oxidoreductase subunit alpha
MADYPSIKSPRIDKLDGDTYYCYDRDPESGARTWAVPGTPTLEHRIGGLEKDSRKGSVSHDPQNHQTMTELRAEKVARVANMIPTQDVMGAPEGDLLVVGWGGTRGHLQSAVEKMQAEGKKVSHCHFNWINPLPHGVEEIFSKFKKIVVCELNMGQFAGYLRMNFPQFSYTQYNKVQGLPFTVDELAHHFDTLLK